MFGGLGVKRKPKQATLFVVGLFLFFSFFVVIFNIYPAQAANPPGVITYQGKILFNSLAVTTTQNMKFVLYNALTNGTPLYTASGTLPTTSTVSVTPSNGLFTIDLGSSGTNNLDPAIFQNNQNVYLEVSVGSEILTPRKQITASPYSYNSKYLNGVGTATNSSTTYIPVSDATGNFNFNGVTSSLLYVNGNSILATTTISNLAGATGNISMWTNNLGYLTTSTNLTVSNFATANISQWFNDVGYVTSTGGEIDPIWNAASSSYAKLGSSNTFTGTNIFATTTVDNLSVSELSSQSLVFTGPSGKLSVTSSLHWDNINSRLLIGGVGTPDYTLDVVGSSIIRGNLIVTGTSTFNNYVCIGGVCRNDWPVGGSADTSTIRQMISASSPLNYDSGSGILTITGSNSSTNGYLSSGDWNTFNNKISSQWITTSSDIYFNGGNVGIGVSSSLPQALLDVGHNFTVDVDGNISTSGTLGVSSTATFGGNVCIGVDCRTSWPTGAGFSQWIDATSGIYYNSGNVGIGTTTPSAKLHVKGGNILHEASGNPTLKGAYDTPGYATNVYVSGQYAYVTDGAAGLQIIDISNPASPTSTGNYNPLGNVSDVYVSGKYAYLTDDAVGLQIIDISNPASPSLVGSNNAAVGYYDVYVSGKYAYVADDGSGLQIIDISNPISPTLISTYDTPDFANGVYVSGKYAYVADKTSGLQIIDISNPASPSFVGSYYTSGDTAYDVYVSGKYAYVADSVSGLQIIDISNPASPSFVGRYNTSFAYDVYVSGKYAYVANGVSGLQIIDISNPASPSLVGSNNIATGYGVYVSGKYAYMGGGIDGLQIIDINGTETPSLSAGNVQGSDLTISENVDIGNNLSVRGGLNVGESGIMINGDFGMSGLVTNTLSFSTTTLFKTAATPTTTNAFIFDTLNSFTPATNTYLLSIRNAGVAKFSVATNGDTVAAGNLFASSITVSTGTSPGDLAERVDINPNEQVEVGDVLVVDPDSQDRYKKSSSAYDQTVAGVVSTYPTIIVGNGKTNYTAAMAMIGRVPVKVSNENGLIKRGDLLVSATLPGYAMKYDSAKDDGLKNVSVIGVALDDFTEVTGKIMILVRTGWVNSRHQSITSLQQNVQELATTQGINLGNNSTVLSVQNNNGQLIYNNGDLNLQGYLILNVKAIVGYNNKWFIDENGYFVTHLQTSAGDKEMYGLQSPQAEFVFSSSSQLIAGEVHINFDTSVREIIDASTTLKINVTLTSGEAKGIYVSSKDATGFTVKELQAGSSNATFDWMVVAKRRSASSQQVTNNNTDIISIPNDTTSTSELTPTSTSTTAPTSPPEVGPPVSETSTPIIVSDPTPTSTPDPTPITTPTPAPAPEPSSTPETFPTPTLVPTPEPQLEVGPPEAEIPTPSSPELTPEPAQ